MKDYLFSHTKKRQYILLAGDVAVIAVSVLLSYMIRVFINDHIISFSVIWPKLDLHLLIVISAHLITLYFMDQYNLGRIVNIFKSSPKVVLSIWLAGICISCIFFFFPKYIFGRQVLLIHLIVLSFMMFFWRFFFKEVLIRTTYEKRLAVVGSGRIVFSFVNSLKHIQNSGFTVKSACLSNPNASDDVAFDDSISIYEDLGDLLESNTFDAIVFDATNGLFQNDDSRRILQVKYQGKEVYDLPTLYKNLTGKIPIDFIDGRWLMNCSGFQGGTSIPYIHIKRSIDVLLSVLFMIILAPLYMVIAAAIKLSSEGDVLFTQERIGLNQKAFQCYKFRTMIKDAERVSGPIWSNRNDTRITRVGGLLRKTRLDELPQLWNILKGDMSFVGPRPIRAHFARMLTEKIPFYVFRFSVKPGLSGWAQVNYHYAGSDFGQLEKFEYELFYIQNMSLFLDIITVVKTVREVFRGSGN